MAIQKLIDAWATPSGLLVIFGCIVWGVQLNFAIMNIQERLSIVSSQAETNSDALATVSSNNVKIGLILEHINDELKKTAMSVDRHEEESEDWKRRIITIEEALRNGKQ